MNPFPQARAPRNFTSTQAGDNGTPHDRDNRIAERRAFVETKQDFLDVVAALDDADAHTAWLRHQVRHAQSPEDLWLLRCPVFAALRRDPVEGARKRQALRRSLDSVFPGTFCQSGFITL
jgi:hypothetical protein